MVYVAGEVDVASAPQLRFCLDDLEGAVIVGLAEVTFLGSIGLNTLVSSRKRLLAGGGQLGLRNPQPSVRRILQVANMDDWFDSTR